jgi:integrase/recombinase XerC
MNDSLTITTYRDGERICPACGEALPAHDTWPGARFRHCGRSKCTDRLRQHDNGRFVSSGTLRCSAEGCTEFVPEGFYGSYASFLCCSSHCWQHRRTKRQEHVLCACGCGEHVQHRVRKALHGLAYVSKAHQGRHEQELFFEQAFGRFRPVIEEYLSSFVALHYRAPKTVRSSLARFFRYLNEVGIESLSEVDCNTVTQFLIWVQSGSRGVKTDLLSCISTFFKWLQMTGRRTAGNPINSFLHRPKKPHRLPRPLSTDEQRFAWELLQERGDARLRLAFAIGQESGMRIGEICRIRLSDVDASARRIFVRLPNKKNRERYALFGVKTAKYLTEWLAERDASCGHDQLLYNYSHLRTTFNTDSLGGAFSRVLCKTYKGKILHDRGFEKWSTHRLRHTMSTNLVAGGADAAVVMAAGGWLDPDTMAGYTKINDAQVERGYQEAMHRVEQEQHKAPKTRILTPQELLELRRGAPQKFGNVPAERCV